VRCSFRGSLTRGSGLLLRAAAAVRGRVQRPRRGWDRWSCWHRASDLQRIPGGKSSAGAAACRRCPRGASSSWGAYAAAHRRRINPAVSGGALRRTDPLGNPCGGNWMVPGVLAVRRGGSGAGRCRVRSLAPSLCRNRSSGPPFPGRPGSDCVRYLVDSASSHMLVSKIKPCMSKYKQIYTVKLRMAH
jgi:hypothetical protein